MAVMTTQYSEAVALEQKTQPVPSSDKMALDLDINGTSTRDETNFEFTTDATLNKPTLSPSNHVATEFPEVNGSGNRDAFSSNQTILQNLSEPSSELKSSPTSALDFSQLPDTNTTTNAEISASLEEQQFETALVSTESAIESAIEDAAPTSTVPPVVEAPESDLRDTDLPPAPEAVLDEQSQTHALDLDLDEHTLANRTADLDVDPNSQGADMIFEQPPTADLDLPVDSTPPQQSAATLDPSPAKIEPGNTESVDAMAETKDIDMKDAAELPAKVSREREDDDEDEPSAKRTKTEDAEMSLMDAPQQNGETSGEHKDDQILTDHYSKEIIRIIKTVARTKDGKNFRQPVAKLWPNFAAAYAEKIPNEVDLETMETKLKNGEYTTIDDVKDDINLLLQNALAFNGSVHAVTNSARETRKSLLAKIANISSEPPAPVEKKKKSSTKKSTPVPDAPRAAARRQSRGSHGAVLPAAQPTQTFALDPTSNMPLIRRDSTKIDGGRPKREIHPPKNKDLPYSVRPKSKKFAHELKFCEDILTEMNKSKYREFVSPFQFPVDPVALNIPQYFTIIKKPMDLSTMSAKLKDGTYQNAADFEKDMRQMIWNCFKFNPQGNPVNLLGKRMEDLFNSQWARKEQYVADRSPPAASPVSGGESSDEDEEEDAAAVKTQESTLTAAKERLLEEQQKLITLMGAKHPDAGLVQMQKDMVSVIQKRISEDEALLKMKPKKAKAPKASKKAAPPKKPAAAAKKGGGNRQSQKYMGTLEKETISAGLGALPDDVSNEVLADIKRERPGIDAGEDGTLELDIDMISIPLLWKIHGLIMEYAPDVQDGIKKSMAADSHPKPQPKAAAPKKKNKPMSKYEQERNIDALSKTLNAYERQTSGSQEPVLPTVEQQDESSGDDDSDSEEE